MIQNVRSGQALTAGLLNNIIAQANGQDIPFNENFFNTDKGTLYIGKQDYEVRTDDASFYNFLECWIDNAPEITSRTEEEDTSGGSSQTMKPYILVNLGNEAETAKKNITVNNKPVDGIILISHNESLDAEVTDEILEKNLFVQLAEIDSSSENMYDVHFILFKAIRVTDDDNPPKILGYIFAISKEDVESAKDRAKSIIRQIQGFSELTHLEVLNNKKILATTKIADNDILIQNVIGSQDLIDDNSLSSDTDVSNRGEKLNQYSVEIKSTVVEKEDATGESIPAEVKYAQLYNFDDAVVSNGIDKKDVKKYSILVRFDASQESNSDDSGSDDESSSGEITDLDLLELKYVQYIYYSSDTKETESEDPNKTVSKSVELWDTADEENHENSEEQSFIRYYKLYNFTKANSTEDFTLSVNNEEKEESSEAPEYNFLVRKKLGNTYELAYVDLNIVGDLSAKSISVDIFGDADENSGLETKSITSITEKDNDGKETKCFQLYNFDNYETITTDISTINDYDILVRDGKELKYAKLSIDLSSAIEDAINKEIGVPTVDSNIVETKSLDEKEKDGTVYFQLHNFDVKTTIDTNVSTIPQYDILIRDGDELKYTKLSIDLSSTSADIELDNKSINYNDENKVQIFDFNNDDYKSNTNLATLIKGSGSESEGDESNGELLFRSNGQLEYLPIGKLNLSGTTEISVDNKSINYTTDNKLQVFNFDKGTTLTDDLATSLTSDTSDKGEVLVRKDGEIGYMSIGQLTSTSDTQLSVANDTIIGYALEYSYDYEITLKRGRLTIENNVLKLVPDDTLTQKISTTPISEIIR